MAKASIIENLKQFDAALREIAILDVRVAEAAVTRKDEILAAEGKFAARTGLMVGRRQILVDQLELYYRAHRAELETGTKKSITLQFGTAGIKTGAAALKLLKSWNWGHVLEVMDKAYIRSKETVNKEALKAAKLSDEQLASFGLRLAKKEKFFVETFPLGAEVTTDRVEGAA